MACIALAAPLDTAHWHFQNKYTTMPAEAAGTLQTEEASAMPAAANKTQATDADVDRFIAALPEPDKRADAAALLEIMRQVTKLPAKMWGPSIIGFGEAHYVYET